MEFIERLCELIVAPRCLSAAERHAVSTSFEDTVAVTLAGWGEPSARAVRKVYSGEGAELFDGSFVQNPEQAALVYGVAGHALDYDDVHLTSVTHPSVVLVSALLAMTEARPNLAPRIADAYAVGLGTNIALGEALGFGHYDRGWHATSTLGPLSGAAALSVLLGFDRGAARNALSLAATQSGGLQLNFGTGAKHLQAGQAAAAAVRAVLLSEAGIDGSPDVFGETGFFDLYGGVAPGKPQGNIRVQPDTLSVSRKLFPCCYLTHRMIAAALGARAALSGEVAADARITVDVPYGGMQALKVRSPETGAQAKFCAAYCVAAALEQGHVGLPDFEDNAVHRPALRKLMSQIETREDPLVGDMPVGIDHGTVRLRIEQAGNVRVETEVRHYPGSPGAPPDPKAFDAKLLDCLAIWQRETGRSLSLEAFRSEIRTRLGAYPSETRTGTK